jgi:hypothetical protein
MTYLTPSELSALRDAILDNLGYKDSIREIFLSDVNNQFKHILAVDNIPMVQLEMDLAKLNRTERLVDGTIPFQSWLNKVGQYLRQYPEINITVQEALSKIESIALKAEPVKVSGPSSEVVNKVVQEKIISQNDMVSYAFLEGGWKAGIGVVRLQVPRYNGGFPLQSVDGGSVIYSGTGWLLTKDLIITNHHVVNARSENEADASDIDFNMQGKHSAVDFDFNSDNMIPQRVSVLNLEASNKELDFAILRLTKVVNRVPPRRSPTEIFVTSMNLQVVNIIQHPFGHAKKVAFRNNHIFESTFPKVFYFTDTEKGSSGSPVFNDNWEVVALHRASKLVKDVDYKGKSTGWVNEGVQLKAIFDFLEVNYNILNNEILRNQ